MIHYFSAPTSPGYLKPIFEANNVQSYLLSYAVDASKAKQYKKYDDVIIDSGAFSAWSKGEKIVISKYKGYCHSLQMFTNKNWKFVNLDVIPQTGSSKAEIEKCCEKGFENFLYLKSVLNNVIPVYHYGDDIKWLKKYLDHTDYVGISPANDTSETVKQKYLNYVFDYLPLDIKTHAFGYTTPFGMRKYPFYSVDSISYKAAALFGHVFYYNRNTKQTGTMDLDEFKTKNGLSRYESRADTKLLIEALKFSIRNLLDLMEDITEAHKTMDFAHLKAQKTLF